MSPASIIRKNIKSSCDSIINNIRSSPLNYSLQETPFSLYLSIRKSIRKPSGIFIPEFENPELLENELEQETCKQEIERLSSKCEALEKACEALKNNYEDAVNDSEKKYKYIIDLEAIVKTLHEKVGEEKAASEDTLTKEAKAAKEVNRLLQIKHEKICSDNRILKKESEDLKKEIDIKNVALKSALKETKDATKIHEKDVRKYENEIENLLNYKMSKS